MSSQTLHLYPDGSHISHGTGGGVAIYHPSNRIHNKNKDLWTFHAYSYHPNHTSTHAEIRAILSGLQTLISLPLDSTTTVMIHTDSQTAIQFLNARQNKQEKHSIGALQSFTEGILAAMVVLDARGVRCEAEWVKGHAGEEGNEFADLLAKYGARRCRDGVWEREFRVGEGQMRGLEGGRGMARFGGGGRARRADARMEHVRWAEDRVQRAEVVREEKVWIDLT